MYFLTCIIDEMYEFDRVEDMKALYDSVFNEKGERLSTSYDAVRVWAYEMLDMAEIPQGTFRNLYMIEVRHRQEELIKYIGDNCCPEVQEQCLNGDERD
jgi:hypothetical protein